MNIEIRPAKYSELEIISQNAEETNFTPEAFSKLLRCAYELEPQYTLFAVVNDNLAGHVVATSKYGRLYLKLAMKGDLLALSRGLSSRPAIDPLVFFGGHICSITVYPPYRRKGIGILLMKRVIDELRANKIKTSVKENNLPSRKLHEKLGFREKKRKSRGWIRYELKKNALGKKN